MWTIVGVCGSLRSASFNMMLLRALSGAAPPGTTIEIASIREIPLYDGDVEASGGIPEPVQRLKESIAKSDGLLIVTPESNNSMPGVLKNTIDWLSRPPAEIQRVFAGRPVAFAGATPGQGGTRLSQAAWLPVVRTLGILPWFESLLMISGAREVFDASGAITDEATRERVHRFAEGCTRTSTAQSRARRAGDQ